MHAAAVAALTTADQVRGTATMISITLAVLSAFATQRASSLALQRAKLDVAAKDVVRRDLAVDVGLAVFGLLLLVAAGPLFFAASCKLSLFRVDTALFALFCLFYVGVMLVEAWVLSVAWRRGTVLKTKTSSSSLWKALRKAGS